jgi:6-pyruvoyltetrahydropterin/6-carboxytetrahydropterin synthase
MYTAIVTATFSATHRVALPDGTLEPTHGHDWTVRAHFSRAALNERGMVVDFCAAESALQAIAAELHHRNLNDLSALEAALPTAEVLAKYLFDRLRQAGFPELCRVEVTEAPGCLAAYDA